MMRFFCSFLLCFFGFAAGLAQAALVGEAAPPILATDWINGHPVEIRPGTNIYVVEIFNTATERSRVCVPILNAIQQQYRSNGVVVVAVSDEPEEQVLHFARKDFTNINYTVAVDNGRQTFKSYLKPLGINAVPYSFIVGRDGNMLWHGLPQLNLSNAVAAIVSGKYDVERAKKLDLAGHQLSQYLILAHEGSDRTAEAGQNLLAARTNEPVLLCELAVAIANAPRLQTRDFALANEALDQAEKADPTNALAIAFGRAEVLYASGKREEGLALAKQLLEKVQNPREKAGIEGWLKAKESRGGVVPPAANSAVPGETNPEKAAGEPPGNAVAGKPGGT